ncbi:MAG: prepilin-type N-terminal cleavage/methylation domain-containing protein [Symploca sp. SIO2E9]|nr:prepilin-type N-terminal cleavage/methylation domain-containing protein [Symploca sp. SIO2E9]
MKTELKAKLLQHLNQKRADQGFTLIELLVVIIIIGILSAIALPSFLNQANKAKQSEAKTYVGSMNRAQQAYFLENGEFAKDEEFGALGLGIQTKTENYEYVIADANADRAVNPYVTNQAQPKQQAIKAYQGGVSLGVVTDTSEATTLAVLCEAKIAFGLNGGQTGAEEIPDPGNDPPDCHVDYESLTGTGDDN